MLPVEGFLTVSFASKKEEQSCALCLLISRSPVFSHPVSHIRLSDTVLQHSATVFMLVLSLLIFSPSPRMMSAIPTKHSHSLHSASFSFSRKPPRILLHFCRTSDSLLSLQRSSSISSPGRKIALAWGRLSHQVTLLLCQWLSYSSMSSSPPVSSALVLTEAGKSTFTSPGCAPSRRVS